MARRSNASPAFAEPLRTAPPRSRETGSDSPVSVDSSRTAPSEATTPSTGTTSPARTTTMSPGTTRSTGTSWTASPMRRCAIVGARSSRATSSRRARRPATASSAFPPLSIRAMTAPARN